MNDSFLMPGKIIKAGEQRNASVAFGSLIKNQIVSAEERAAQIVKEAYENASDLSLLPKPNRKIFAANLIRQGAMKPKASYLIICWQSKKSDFRHYRMSNRMC